jgi:hypothetical protein
MPTQQCWDTLLLEGPIRACSWSLDLHGHVEIDLTGKIQEDQAAA